MTRYETEIEVPYAPQGLAPLYNEGSGTLELSAGSVEVGGRRYEVDARDVEPKRLKTKLAQTDVYLVWRGDRVAYEVAQGSDDAPTERPCETAEGDCLVLVHVARVKVWPEDTERKHREHVYLRQPAPMTETRNTPVVDTDTGEPMFEVWKKVNEVPRSETSDYDDHANTRVEPKTQQETVTVTN